MTERVYTVELSETIHYTIEVQAPNDGVARCLALEMLRTNADRDKWLISIATGVEEVTLKGSKQ